MKDRVDRLAQATKSRTRRARLCRRCDGEFSAAPAQATSEAAERHFNFAEKETSQLGCNVHAAMLQLMDFRQPFKNGFPTLSAELREVCRET